MELKKCFRCGEEKAATLEFYRKDSKIKTGLSGVCRLCQNEQQRNRYGKDKTKSRASTMKWREKNRLKYNAYIRKYSKGKHVLRADLPPEQQEKQREYDRQYREKNRERLNAATREWYHRKKQQQN